MNYELHTDDDIPAMKECWWLTRDSKAARVAMWAAYEVAKSHDTSRAQEYRAMRSVYESGVVQHTATVGETELAVSRHNMIASVIDTAMTKLIDHRPNPMVITSGADILAQQQSQNLSKWTGAAAQDCKMHKVVEKAAKEAAQVGTGAFRTFERNGRPAAEIAFCDHIYVDRLEAYNDAVLTFYQERYIDRHELARMFPTKKAEVKDAAGAPSADAAGAPEASQGTSDMVLVVQAWRCALSDAPGDEGRFLIGTSAGVLLDKPYKSEDAPFTFLRWRSRSRSFWGIGLVEMLAGAQEQLDAHTETIDASLDALPPAIIARKGSIKRGQMDDGIVRIYEVDGSPSDVQLWAPGDAAVSGHGRREAKLEETIYHLAGVSGMEAGAQKPAGLSSGRALLVHQDVKSQRLLMQARDIEDAYVDGFRRLILVADGIWEGRKDNDNAGRDRMRYLAGAGDDVEELAYGDVRISDALYRVQVFPVSKLADSPSGRFDRVQELIQAGMLQAEEGLDLLDFPDLHAAIDSRTSTRKWARKLVTLAIMGRDVAETVTPDDDLPEVARFGRQMRAKALMSGTSHDQLTKLSELLGAVTTLQKQQADAAAAAAAAAMPPPPGPPMGTGPMTPPTGPGPALPAA